MTPTISCFNYHWFDNSFKFIFIEFDNFFKVIVNNKMIVLTKQELTSNSRLFQVYLISLLLTEDTKNIVSFTLDKSYIYGIRSRWYVKTLDRFNMVLKDTENFTMISKLSNRNPLNASSPKRSSGAKKIRKVMKLINKFYADYNITDLSFIVTIFYRNETQLLVDYFERYIAHEKKIEMLSVILHNYGRDVYSAVNKFL
jgi:hypothetical protein